jgi:hypothetical protein
VAVGVGVGVGTGVGLGGGVGTGVGVGVGVQVELSVTGPQPAVGVGGVGHVELSVPGPHLTVGAGGDGEGEHDGSLGLALQPTGGVGWLLSEGGGQLLPLLSPYTVFGLILPMTKANADIDDKSINTVNRAIIDILLC